MDDSSEGVARQLARAYLLMNRRVDRAMTQAGASLAQTKLLMFIAGACGNARATDIADLLGQAPRTVTEAIDKLERDGLVRRVADPDDRRVKRLAITPAGSAAIAASEPLRRELVADVFGALDTNEQAMLGDLLARVADHLSDERILRLATAK